MRGIAVVAIVAWAGAAAAQPSPSAPDDAGALFERARELKTAGRLAESCALFERSYQLDPAPGTALNLADCFEQQGQLHRAWTLFDQVAREPGSTGRSSFARRRADALVGKLATVVIALPDPLPPGLVVRLGDETLPPALEIRALVDPGPVALVASVPGHPTFTATLLAVAGEIVSARVPAFADRRGRSPRALVIAGSLATLGVASLGVSLGFAIAARRANQDALDPSAGQGCMHTPAGLVCADDASRRRVHLAGARADLATGFAIGGAALAGVAATVFLLSRDTMRVSPIATVGGAGIGVAARF